MGLMLQSYIVTLLHCDMAHTETHRALVVSDEKKSQRLENYGFQASMLRFVHFQRFYVQNRLKSRGKIWKRTKIVVPLHCQSEDGRALITRDTKR